MELSTKVREYLNKNIGILGDQPFDGFSEKYGDPFDSQVVSEEEDYLKHKTRLITIVHEIASDKEECYVAFTGTIDYEYGSEIDEWYFVKPVEVTSTVYKRVKDD
jgi:hypothetical protein